MILLQIYIIQLQSLEINNKIILKYSILDKFRKIIILKINQIQYNQQKKY